MIGQRKLRQLQDDLRNRGWRIQWIPWQAPGKVEVVYNTPLTRLTGYGCMLTFFASIAYLVGASNDLAGSSGGISRGALVAIFTSLGSLGVILLGRLYAARHKQAGWQSVAAVCIDQEIRCRPRAGRRSEVWEYRLLCAFDYQGYQYTVTPETSHVIAFHRQEALHAYLQERIDVDGACRLLIDPDNPLHAVFDQKQSI